ncbi:MAG: SusD, outer membrane protein, partial [uncultured Gemmatimonadaceae bacterium]
DEYSLVLPPPTGAARGDGGRRGGGGAGLHRSRRVAAGRAHARDGVQDRPGDPRRPRLRVRAAAQHAVDVLQPQLDHHRRAGRAHPRQRLVRQRALARDPPPHLDGELRLGGRGHERALDRDVRRGRQGEPHDRHRHPEHEPHQGGHARRAAHAARLVLLRPHGHVRRRAARDRRAGRAEPARDARLGVQVHRERAQDRAHHAPRQGEDGLRAHDEGGRRRDPGEHVHQRARLPGHGHGGGAHARGPALPGGDRGGRPRHQLRPLLARVGLPGELLDDQRGLAREHLRHRELVGPRPRRVVPDARAALQLDRRERRRVERLRDAGRDVPVVRPRRPAPLGISRGSADELQHRPAHHGPRRRAARLHRYDRGRDEGERERGRAAPQVPAAPLRAERRLAPERLPLLPPRRDVHDQGGGAGRPRPHGRGDRAHQPAPAARLRDAEADRRWYGGRGADGDPQRAALRVRRRVQAPPGPHPPRRLHGGPPLQADERAVQGAVPDPVAADRQQPAAHAEPRLL